jgi:hypothetical protein
LNRKEQRKQQVEEYYQNPNRCLQCNEIIPINERRSISEARKQKFCNYSCSAKYNNPITGNLKNTWNTDNNGQCIQCGEPKEIGRYCRACYLERKRKIANERYRQYGKVYYGKSLCINCGKEITLFRKVQKFCLECSSKLQSELGNNTTNNYIMDGERPYHRVLMEDTLRRSLDFNEVVHHLDEDIYNNQLSNLLVISRADHAKLHSILRHYKYDNENYTKHDVVLLTNKWIEDNNINVIRVA